MPRLPVFSSFFLFWLFSACSVGDVYDFQGLGEPCDRTNRCAHHLRCVEGFCIDPAGNSDGGVDADVDDVVDAGDDADVTDAAPDADADGGSTCGISETPCGTTCCSIDETCLDETCVPRGTPCNTDEECAGDTYCNDAQCIPYGFGPRGSYNPDCGHVSVAGLFKPVLQCAWSGPPAGDPWPAHTNVLSTPLVVDFDFDNDPGTITPSIVFVSYDGLDGSSGYYNGAHGVIRVLDGATCEQQYNVGSQLNGCNTPAIGDLDGDGRPEIIAHTGLGGVQAFTWDATSDSFVQLFHGHDAGGTNITYGAQSTGWSSVAVHDINGDGHPEVISYGLIYDHTGLQISNNVNISNGLRYPAVADLDRDGAIEMCTGHTMYRYNTGTNLWDTVWTIGTGRYFTAYADFGTYPLDPSGDDRKIKDGTAEIVVVAGGTAWVINIHGRTIFGPVAFPAGSGGGPPTAGDFDGDGRVEFSAASSDSISVFDPDCTGIPDVSTCLSLRTDGILWHQVSQDHSSNQTGSSLFDFEGDGRVEVIYADETFTRVYDGRTGEVLFSQWHSSCTWNENPIVADVDGDFNAELVVPSNLNCSIAPSTAGGIPYPSSHLGNPMDPLYKGFRCGSPSDCASGVCDMNFCRCTSDDECGGAGSGYVCDVPVSGTPGSGDVCRSEWLGDYPGIRVYADALDRWVSSRTIWNQHTYSVTNVSEAGIVPPLSSWVQNWTAPALNNFRQNVQGSVAADTAPDVTPRGELFTCTVGAIAEFSVELCNRGTQPLPPALPVTAYEETAFTPLCTAATSVGLAPGQCQLLSCSWDTPPHFQGDAVNVIIVADDDGTGASSTLECNESNNSVRVTDVWCEVVGK